MATLARDKVPCCEPGVMRVSAREFWNFREKFSGFISGSKRKRVCSEMSGCGGLVNLWFGLYQGGYGTFRLMLGTPVWENVVGEFSTFY